MLFASMILTNSSARDNILPLMPRESILMKAKPWNLNEVRTCFAKNEIAARDEPTTLTCWQSYAETGIVGGDVETLAALPGQHAYMQLSKVAWQDLHKPYMAIPLSCLKMMQDYFICSEFGKEDPPKEARR